MSPAPIPFPVGPRDVPRRFSYAPLAAGLPTEGLNDSGVARDGRLLFYQVY